MTAREWEIAADATLNAEHPWLGLASFTEAASAYFHGREEEIAELVRRVQRKTLTILFGQSGLGKTSILNAGVVPRLRGQGFCPVYVRVDYADGTPSPSEQIKQAILRESRAQGQWTQSGVASAGESLWEFLHHRDDMLHDAAGRPLLPLLIFDQFEELFTLAQSDEAGRAKAALFVADLADLVENRAPRALEAAMLDDDAIAERFDFSRNDYRVLIALREDYLAPLEALKAQMPSITQNRMRLAPMTGVQAMAAVRGPGGHLVGEEVAGAIVRFVAGGGELAHAEVEPSLLSLMCRELNDARLAKGQREISVDLLAGSHAAILSDFYERALADQPAALRAFVEDVLLTDSGYRENVAEERVRREFAATGAAPDALATLVNRRLLRIEERLDLRRVELTHDVLCGVVKASRDARREREARELAERELVAQQQRARDARRQLHRARRVATACLVLAACAVAASGYAYWSSQRAKQAEALANASRTQAEGMMSYLLDDFYEELAPVGRLDLIVGLGQQAVDYYAKLPPALRNATTTRNHALAATRLAEALDNQNRIAAARAQIVPAVQELEQLRVGGDVSEATTVALAEALRAESRLLVAERQLAQARDTTERAQRLLEPLAARPDASVAVLQTQAQLLSNLGYLMMNMDEFEPALTALRASQAMSARLGGADSHDATRREVLRATADYAGTGPWEVGALLRLGRADEARAAGARALARLDWLLSARPEHNLARYLRATLYGNLSWNEGVDMQAAQTLRYAEDSLEDWKRLVEGDPSNARYLNNLAVAWVGVYSADWALGQTHAAVAAAEQNQAAAARAKESSFSLVNRLGLDADLVQMAADAGMLPEAEAALADIHGLGARLLRLGNSPEAHGIVACTTGNAEAALALAGSPRGGTATLAASLAALQASGQKLSNDADAYCLRPGYNKLGQAALQRGDAAAAEQAYETLNQRFEVAPPNNLGDRRDRVDAEVGLALAQAREGRLDAARASLAPALATLRAALARPHDDLTLQLQQAQAEFVEALVEPAQHAALLRAAAAHLDGLPAEMRATHTVTRWRAWIAAAAQGHA